MPDVGTEDNVKVIGTCHSAVEQQMTVERTTLDGIAIEGSARR